MTAPKAEAVSVARLTVHDFRCHRHLRLESGEESVVLTGPNGSGKTSVLEALSLLGPGRGLRRARFVEIARRGEPGGPVTWAVAARLRTPTGTIDIATGQTDEGGERRQIRIDGQPAKSQAALANVCGIVWLTPDVDRLFLDGASARRRFLDRLIFGVDSAHAARVAAFERALQQRSLLLRRGRADPAWLDALEEALSAHGVAMAVARRDMADRLTATARALADPFPAVEVEATGAVEQWLLQAPALTVEERLRQGLAASRLRDAETGGATVGPHRSDIAVRHAPTGRAAQHCSTGEQKTLLIAMVLAGARLVAIERRSAPLLLLDEVVAHLDAFHRHALFAIVAELGAQAWYAGTDVAAFAPLARRARLITLGEARPPAPHAACVVATIGETNTG